MERAGAATPEGNMPGFLMALQSKSRAEAPRARVQEQDLRQWGLTGIHLRPYQLQGVNWLAQCFHCQNGCILGDEMGLGKTCQTIALFIYLAGRLNDEGPFLILCPLSVLSNWKEEMERFAPGLYCVTYAGDKDKRACLQEDLKQESRFHVLLTTYEICLKDASFLKSFPWSVLVVDEAHRLKNQSSLLHKTLSEFSVVFTLLLTGTPIQNSLQELYSLLSFVEPDLFSKEQVEDFVQRYQDIEKESESASELYKLLQPFLLRRVKAEVATELPRKTEVMIYHGMSALQKKYYKAILMKDLDAFENEMAKKVKLQNVLSQLRKCVDHPYLFDGGVGMNLTAADTVIFFDSDFNPQNDLQAAARAHRIGQNKSVKVIRLIGRDTVEEIVYRKAASKLQLTNMIIEGGHFTLGAQKRAADTDLQLSEILKFGLDKLLSSEGSTMHEIDLESILGETEDGHWVSDALPTAEEGSREPEEGKNHMYLFEGKDYSKEPSKEDRESFEQLVNLQKTLLEKTSQEGRLLRNKGNVPIPGLVEGSAKRKRILSPEELEDRRKKRQEAVAKRKRLLEEKRKKKEEAEHKKKMAWWESNNYQSFCLPSEESEPEDGEDESSAQLEYEDPDSTSIRYVCGDVTHPQAGAEDAVIVHCVDDSGRWGRGGLFTALETRSAEPRKRYELAGKMKDLSLGGVLLFPIDDKESRNEGQDLLALIVAQHRDRANVLSGIKMAALEEALKKIFLAAKKRKASVHLPRIGHATKGFNWYGTERLIRKHLASRGIPTYIYYFPRSKAAILHLQASSSSSGQLVS
ncbi:chromodomain-helicase-DNA-binding protein 1-like isoform X3 [Bubalus kerabau]|uniref:chromodomain-helicase-DNA-binding protein 1-like isoform X3 n=1 Tax=Bubalus bubalis TaxID=89462 RepID=UPI001D11A108|nr:chromodomain-helicase-DNA-binding protein 1-like isoform X3 [Bubalus bubalis]XP_055440534.1 chromodomain-helicase-DNA-binding protein 1-like isoform X3 [Bubalus carabanensis]